jgi:hypothetical protein
VGVEKLATFQLTPPTELPEEHYVICRERHCPAGKGLEGIFDSPTKGGREAPKAGADLGACQSGTAAMPAQYLPHSDSDDTSSCSMIRALTWKSAAAGGCR